MTSMDSTANERRRTAALADEQFRTQMPINQPTCTGFMCDNVAAPGSNYCKDCQPSFPNRPPSDPVPGGTDPAPDVDLDDLIPRPSPEFPRTRDQKLTEALERLRRVEKKLDELLEGDEDE